VGRRRFKFFEPASLPRGYTPPAAPTDIKASLFKYSPPPPPDDDDTAVDVDKAKKRLTITSDYSPSLSDHFIGVNTSSNQITITLPSLTSANEGKIYTIKDEGGRCSKNRLLITTSNGATIDGESTIVLQTDYVAINVYYNSSNWHIY